MIQVPSDLAQVRTLAELFAWRVATSPDTEAYRVYDPTRSAWVSLNWRETGARVMSRVQALAASRLPDGARVAVLLPNGIEGVCIDQAALALGCVPVPMHALDNAGSIAYILADSGAALLVVDTSAQWQAILAIGTALPALVRVVVCEDDVPLPDSLAAVQVSSLADWLSTGAGSTVDAAVAPREVDLAALVYTSGTTGKPKGVMLTHANVVANVKATLMQVPCRPDDVYLSFLPFSHTFERTAGYYVAIAAGCCVAYARSVSLLTEDLTVVRPTVLVSVPRIYERVYSRLQQVLAASPAKAVLFQLAVKVGWRRFCHEQRLDVAPAERSTWAWLDPLLWPVLRQLIAKPLLARFGGRVRVAISGGAALPPTIARCFLALGLPVLQGYGMTESSPIVSCNAPDDNDPATVGRPLPGLELRIGDNRELLLRGPSVMKGYWHRPEDTARAFTDDGWLHTGDQAAIEDGRIRIQGRIKEIIVTSTGEKVSPGDLEQAVTADTLFEQALIVGENRPFIAAVVVLNGAEWTRLASVLGLDPADPANLRAAPALDVALQRMVTLTGNFPRYALPRAVLLTLEPWTTENGLMTPTLKLKRNHLMDRFGADIESLYQSRGRKEAA